MPEEPSDDRIVVTREIDLPVDPGEAWDYVGDGWSRWLADEVEVDVVPGAEGRLVDDEGVERTVRVDAVEPGRSVRFRWWPADAPARASEVVLEVIGRPLGATVTVREVWPSTTAATPVLRAALAWSVRDVVLWSGVVGARCALR